MEALRTSFWLQMVARTWSLDEGDFLPFLHSSLPALLRHPGGQTAVARCGEPYERGVGWATAKPRTPSRAAVGTSSLRPAF